MHLRALKEPIQLLQLNISSRVGDKKLEAESTQVNTSLIGPLGRHY
jgi:hypothetical protein